mmetsp:Transcript_28522/g.69398  ORF Transcript_28522/g.69398 Transcript_28522/m.69398 type:complete len:278 (-) Transcript_28522:119-952(-)
MILLVHNSPRRNSRNKKKKPSLLMTTARLDGTTATTTTSTNKNKATEQGEFYSSSSRNNHFPAVHAHRGILKKNDVATAAVAAEDYNNSENKSGAVRFDAVHIREHSITTFLPPTTITKTNAGTIKVCIMRARKDDVRLPVTLDWSHTLRSKSISVNDYELIRERRHNRNERGQLTRLPYHRRKYLLEKIGALTEQDLQVADEAWITHSHDLMKKTETETKKTKAAALEASNGSGSGSGSEYDVPEYQNRRPLSKTVTHCASPRTTQPKLLVVARSA